MNRRGVITVGIIALVLLAAIKFTMARRSDIASLEDIGAGGTDPGFAEELADLDVPSEDEEQ